MPISFLFFDYNTDFAIFDYLQDWFFEDLSVTRFWAFKGTLIYLTARSVMWGLQRSLGLLNSIMCIKQCLEFKNGSIYHTLTQWKFLNFSYIGTYNFVLWRLFCISKHLFFLSSLMVSWVHLMKVTWFL